MCNNHQFACSFATDIATPINVALTSTLLFKKFSYSGDVVTFICVTKGSVSIVWFSDQYIDGHVEFAAVDDGVPRQINPNVVATLVSAEVVNGTQILTSQLMITVTSDYANPLVTCLHVSDMTNVTASFEVLSGMHCFMHSFIKTLTRCLIVAEHN